MIEVVVVPAEEGIQLLKIPEGWHIMLRQILLYLSLFQSFSGLDSRLRGNDTLAGLTLHFLCLKTKKASNISLGLSLYISFC